MTRNNLFAASELPRTLAPDRRTATDRVARLAWPVLRFTHVSHHRLAVSCVVTEEVAAYAIGSSRQRHWSTKARSTLLPDVSGDTPQFRTTNRETIRPRLVIRVPSLASYLSINTSLGRLVKTKKKKTTNDHSICLFQANQLIRFITVQ